MSFRTIKPHSSLRYRISIVVRVIKRPFCGTAAAPHKTSRQRNAARRIYLKAFLRTDSFVHPVCRIDPRSATVVFPADGRHLCVPDLSRCEGLFVKGQMFDLAALLGEADLARRYANGSLLLSRLCPVDYHRYHFPAAGVPGPARLVNGPLKSVNPIALCQNISILATNKRCLTLLETTTVGTVLLIEVGATCVGSICPQTQCDVCAVSLRDIEAAVCEFAETKPVIVALQPMALCDILSDMRQVANAIGDEAAGERLVGKLQRRFADLAATRPTKSPFPTVACIEWLDPLMVAGNWIDLTTHAVCVGMTGSGKTGLCLSLLEEAAIDGIPAICVDPKGDIGNLLLSFPDLQPGDFEPWIDHERLLRRR